MTNPMPRFAVVHHRNVLGYVSAVSHAQAMQRAKKLYPNKRIELDFAGGPAPRAADKAASARAFQAKRAPYATGDFEARRKAAIAAYL